MNDDSYVPLIQDDNKNSTSYKKYGAALGVAGITLAAALLLSGRSNAPLESPVEAMNESDIYNSNEMVLSNDTTDLYGYTNPQETCLTSFDRIWNNDVTIWSPKFKQEIQTNGKFVDLTFPPDNSSLWWQTQMGNQYVGPAAKFYQKEANAGYGIIWDRPTILEKSPSLWGRNGVTPKGSKQGDLGDCWFLSSASAIAAVPERIHRIFQNQNYPVAEGAFGLYFYVRGEKVSVTIDDLIPFYNRGNGYIGLPVNSRQPPSGAWWLVMLEKAFAKLNVNYANLNLGNCTDALRTLTGMPVSHHLSNQITDDQLYEIATSGAKARNPMTASITKGTYGLMGNHAYGLLDGICLTTNGVCAHRLIKMRNPYGYTGWNGPWNNNDPYWTADWKRQAGLATIDEGEFYVGLTDWRSIFADAYNTHYRDDWMIRSAEGKPADYTSAKQSFGYLLMTNTVQQDVVLECFEYNFRLFPQQAQTCETQYSPIFFNYQVWDSKGQQVKTPEYANCSHGTATELKNLAAGQYYISVFDQAGTNVSNNSSIWKMRSFAYHNPVELVSTANPWDY